MTHNLAVDEETTGAVESLHVETPGTCAVTDDDIDPTVGSVAPPNETIKLGSHDRECSVATHC